MKGISVSICQLVGWTGYWGWVCCDIESPNIQQLLIKRHEMLFQVVLHGENSFLQYILVSQRILPLQDACGVYVSLQASVFAQTTRDLASTSVMPWYSTLLGNVEYNKVNRILSSYFCLSSKFSEKKRHTFKIIHLLSQNIQQKQKKTWQPFLLLMSGHLLYKGGTEIVF